MKDFLIRKEYFGALIIDNSNLKFYRVNDEVLNVIFDIKNVGLKAVINKYLDVEDDFSKLITFFNSIELIANNIISSFRYIDNLYSTHELSSPLKVFLELTEKCNLKCKHCFNSSGEKLYKELNTNQINNLIENFYELGIPIIKLSGGEPFLRDDIFEILNTLELRKIHYIIHTNGLMLNEEKVEKLKIYKYLDSIRVSIDGSKVINDDIRGMGTYEKAINSLNLLVENDINCGLNFTLNKHNYMDIENLINDINYNKIDVKIGTSKISGRFLKNKDLLEFKDNNEFSTCLIKFNSKLIEINEKYNKCKLENPITNNFEFEEDSKYMLFYDRFACMAGTVSCTIKANGDVYPCGLFSENKEFNCGNITKLTLKEIWNTSKGMNLLRDIKINEECKQCKYMFKKCTGGCRGNAFNYYNSLSAFDPHCRKETYNILGYEGC